MSELSERYKDHLMKALQFDDPQQKNYHIRQVLQMSNTTELPEDVEVESGISDWNRK